MTGINVARPCADNGRPVEAKGAAVVITALHPFALRPGIRGQAPTPLPARPDRQAGDAPGGLLFWSSAIPMKRTAFLLYGRAAPVYSSVDSDINAMPQPFQ